MGRQIHGTNEGEGGTGSLQQATNISYPRYADTEHDEADPKKEYPDRDRVFRAPAIECRAGDEGEG